MRQFELSPTPRACFAVDKASDDLFRTRHTRRSDQRQSRTAGGKRAVKTATDHSASTGQTPRLPEHRPASAGAPGQDGSDLEQALFLVQPETLLRWHHELFRIFWKRKSKVHARKPRLSPETISLIKEMAAHNRLWGAERIRGELLKLDIRVSKRTIQKYMRHSRSKRPSGQNWRTFLRNHAAEVWACDFLQVTDLFFRPLFAFFIIELQSRKVIHVNVTRSPTDPWVAQQLREATPYGQTPKYLIRDNDRKFGSHFARVATTSGMKVLRTPYQTPRANAVSERFLLSVRRECLDHFLVCHEKHLSRLLMAYTVYFNQARPHQGIQQRIPDPPILSAPLPDQPPKVIAVPTLGGLHHDYQRVA